MLLADIGIAALVAAVVLLVVDGVAIAALLAIVVLLVGSISFVFDAWRAESRSRRARPPKPSSRSR
jgi:hypothetical protein